MYPGRFRHDAALQMLYPPEAARLCMEDLEVKATAADHSLHRADTLDLAGLLPGATFCMDPVSLANVPDMRS